MASLCGIQSPHMFYELSTLLHKVFNIAKNALIECGKCFNQCALSGYTPMDISELWLLDGQVSADDGLIDRVVDQSG